MTPTRTIQDRDHPVAVPMWLLPLSLALASAILALDLSLPPGVAGGIPYVALVLLGLRASRPALVWGLAVGATGLTILGSLLSPPGETAWVAATNRGLALLAIWITAALVYDRTRIGARLRESRALAESEARFRDFAEAASDWSWEMDAELRFTWMSENVARTTGAPAEWHYGKTRRELLGDDHDREAWDQHMRALEERRPFRDFVYRRLGDGVEPKWIRTSGIPIFDADGRFRGYRGTASDVTAEVELRELAHETERRLRYAIESIDQGFVLFDAADRLVLYNQRYRELNSDVEDVLQPGVPFETIVRRSVERRRLAEGEDAVEAFVQRRMAYHRDATEPIEEPYPGDRWVRLYERRTSDGGYVGIRTDITRERRTEQALRDSETRFRDFAEAASDWFWETDAELRFTWMSLRAGEVAGVPPEWNYGRTRAELIDASIDPGGWAAHQKALDERKPFKNFVYRRKVDALQGPDPGYVWTRTSGVPVFAEDGTFLGYRGCGSDVTKEKLAEEALRESEALLRVTADALPAPVLHVDAGERLVFVNRTAEQWFARPRSELIGRPLGEAHLGEAYAAVGPAYRKALAGRPVTLDTTIPYPDGARRDVHVNYAPLFADDGRVAGFVSLSLDVTEQRRAEEQLRQAQKMEVVGQLTAGVAHDFNNMLAVISGNAELLAEAVGADNPLLSTLLRATRRGSELTQRLLAFSRKQVLRPEAISLNALITDVTGLLRRTLEAHIEIETVRGAGLWNCEADPAQMESALVNLAINARDAMPEGGKLTIETANARLDDDYAAAQAEVRPGQYVMLAVTDTGAGMPAAVRAQAFEPFFTTKPAGAGSGLGLSMVYGFVKQSGGHVSIYSEPGKGTTVKLYLPRSREAAVAERRPATDEVPVARGETVLVVEDDPDVRALAVTLLSRLGYRVVEAATGAAALERLGSTPRTDLLLTDLVLSGGMSGRALAKEAERRVPEIEVLYMSGYTENAIVHHGRLDAGARLLQKPFRKADLARAVRRALDGRPDDTMSTPSTSGSGAKPPPAS